MTTSFARSFARGCSWALLLFVFLLFLLVLAVKLLTSIPSCSISWLDANFKHIEGMDRTCPWLSTKDRTPGGWRFVEIDGKVYRETVEWQRSSACAVGVTCFPFISDSDHKSVTMVELAGPVNFEKLKEYQNGQYLSDGTAQFVGVRRIPTLQPPVDLTRIRHIGEGDYATDGRWVLYQELPIINAEPQTFVTLSSEQTNGKMAYSTSKLGKDRNAVYHGALRIAAAEPSNFNLLDIEHPPELGLPRGLLAFDQRHIWRVDGEKVTSLEPTARQLEYLQRQLQKSKSDNTRQN